MPTDVKSAVQQMLAQVDIRNDEVAFGDPLNTELDVVFTASWYFTVVRKDTVLRSYAGSDLLDDDGLREFDKANTEELEKDMKTRRIFSHSLESKSPSEIFALANKVNRLSIRQAKAQCLCPDCRGAQKVDCPNCSGYGLILCPSCQGKEGGCSRCKRTGFIDCPTCRKTKKIPCQKCRGNGRVVLERHIFLEARCNPYIKLEYEKVDDCFTVPPPTLIDISCYGKLLETTPLKLSDADFKEDGYYLMTFKATSQIAYIKFCVTGESKLYDFWCTMPSCTPLVLPSVLDDMYMSIRRNLISGALGKGGIKNDQKLEICKILKSNRFFNSIVRGYENDFDFVTRSLKTHASNTDAYTSKVFTIKERLESILASRKEELSNILSNKLRELTGFLVSRDFSKECCLALVEFISTLKYRRRSVALMWNSATLLMWAFTMLLCFLVSSGVVMSVCIIISLCLSFVVSYFGTKSLMIFEYILKNFCFRNITKFIDLNYDAIRSVIMITGVIIIELAISLM